MENSGSLLGVPFKKTGITIASIYWSYLTTHSPLWTHFKSPYQSTYKQFSLLGLWQFWCASKNYHCNMFVDVPDRFKIICKSLPKCWTSHWIINFPPWIHNTLCTHFVDMVWNDHCNSSFMIHCSMSPLKCDVVTCPNFQFLIMLFHCQIRFYNQAPWTHSFLLPTLAFDCFDPFSLFSSHIVQLVIVHWQNRHHMPSWLWWCMNNSVRLLTRLLCADKILCCCN